MFCCCHKSDNEYREKLIHNEIELLLKKEKHERKNEIKILLLGK